MARDHRAADSLRGRRGPRRRGSRRGGPARLALGSIHPAPPGSVPYVGALAPAQARGAPERARRLIGMQRDDESSAATTLPALLHERARTHAESDAILAPGHAPA